jgi:hypothetical protein
VKLTPHQIAALQGLCDTVAGRAYGTDLKATTPVLRLLGRHGLIRSVDGDELLSEGSYVEITDAGRQALTAAGDVDAKP